MGWWGELSRVGKKKKKVAFGELKWPEQRGALPQEEGSTWKASLLRPPTGQFSGPGWAVQIKHSRSFTAKDVLVFSGKVQGIETLLVGNDLRCVRANSAIPCK